MKYLLTLIALCTVFVMPAEADSVPYGNQLKSYIKHYNRATSTLATSGALGEGAVEELGRKGFSTIIDLRTASEGTEEEKLQVEAAGMSYINIPVTGAGGITDDQLQSFTKAYEATDGLVLMHCGSGNRVGAMLTRYYLSKGMLAKFAFERGRASGMKSSLEAKIRK